MSHESIIRAWKDAGFRNSLSEEQRTLLPKHPAGLLELTDAQLENAAGGKPREPVCVDCTAGIIACTLPLFCGVDR